MPTSYLFVPSRVADWLADLPHLRLAMGDPSREGDRSVAFSVARKSERQLYRVLGNTHYESLASLLRSLDFCLGRGFHQPMLLRTRARSSFQAGLSELGAAEHFLLRGFEVQGLDVGKASDPVPEFLARQSELNVAVEVYHPLEWEGLSALIVELTDVLKNLDLEVDFRFEIRLQQVAHFDESRNLLHVHPAVVARELDAELREAITASLVDGVTERVAAGDSECHVQMEIPDLNVVASVGVVEVVKSSSDLPRRDGSIHHLPLTGYVAEAMFDRLVRHRVRRKAEKAQARVEGKLAVLVVDMASSELRSEFSSPPHRAAFVNSLQKVFGDSIPGYDVMAFCELAGWGKGLVSHFVQYESGVQESALQSMFGDDLVKP